MLCVAQLVCLPVSFHRCRLAPVVSYVPPRLSFFCLCRFSMTAKDETQPDKTQTVTPWDVECDDDKGIDYDKLIRDFGSQAIDHAMIARIERLVYLG